MVKNLKALNQLFENTGQECSIRRSDEHPLIFVLTRGGGREEKIRYTKPVKHLYDLFEKKGTDHVMAHYATSGGTTTTRKRRKKTTRRKVVRKPQVEEKTEEERMAELQETAENAGISKLERKVAEVIDYDFSKLKNHYKGYYFPKFTSNISKRIEMNRNVFLAGPAGCLHGDTEVTLEVDENLANKINFFENQQ